MLLMIGVYLNNLQDKIMIKKRLLIISILSVFSSMAAFSAQDVFEYKNNDGVVEFTDQRKEK